MNHFFRNSSFAILCVVLTGCGGGGGGASAPVQTSNPSQASDPAQSTNPAQVSNTDNSWLHFTPSAVDINSISGRALAFEITATSSKTIPQTFNVGIFDSKGIINTDVSVSEKSPTQYVATLHISDQLAAGTYNGQLEVRLCEDSPTICAKPIDGSPWMIPIKATLAPGTNLTTLTALSPSVPWTNIGANIEHTSYVPVSLDVTKFDQRWMQNYSSVSSQQVSTAPISVSDGVAYIYIDYPGHQNLRAVDQASGSTLWTVELPSNCGTATTAATNGKVFVGTSSCTADRQLSAYDQKTGSLLFTTSVDIDPTVAPLVVGNNLYVIGQDGTVSMLTSAGMFIWQTNLWDYSFTPFNSSQTLTADTQFLYVISNYTSSSGPVSKLSILNLSDGLGLRTNIGLTMNGCSYTAMPALDPHGVLYASCQLSVTQYQLFAYDTVAKKQLWNVDTQFGSLVALAGNTLYAMNGNALEARNLSDGALQWSAVVDPYNGTSMGSPSDLIVTNNLVLITGNTATVAVDLSSHNVVWSFPQGGSMSLSPEGVLYLPSSTLGYPGWSAVNLH